MVIKIFFVLLATILTPPASAQNTPPASAQDTPPASAQDTPPASAQDTPPASAQDTPPASAQDTAKTDLAISTWINEILQSDKARIFDSYVFSMINKVSKKGPTFFQADYKDLNAQGLIRFTGAPEWTLFTNLNPNMKKLSTKKIKKYIFTATGAQRILLCTKSKCKFQSFNGKKAKTIATWPAPEDKAKTAEWLAWWKKKLGYTGIIIDRKDDLYLVAALSTVDPGNSQGLAFQNSDQVEIIDQKKQKVGGLMELVKAEKNFAIFKVIVKDATSKKLTTGTKILVDDHIKTAETPKK